MDHVTSFLFSNLPFFFNPLLCHCLFFLHILYSISSPSFIFWWDLKLEKQIGSFASNVELMFCILTKFKWMSFVGSGRVLSLFWGLKLRCRLGPMHVQVNRGAQWSYKDWSPEKLKEARSLCKSYPEKEQQDRWSQAISEVSSMGDPTSHFQGKPNTSGNLPEPARRQKIFISTLMRGFPPNFYYIKCK